MKDSMTGFIHNSDDILHRTERGWAGHFICSGNCLFRRNTLIEYKSRKWIVSTIGGLYRFDPIEKKKKLDTVGHNRWYETMAFEADLNSPYLDADVSKEISFNSDWGLFASTWDELTEKYPKPDAAANDMHETVVSELMGKIIY